MKNKSYLQMVDENHINDIHDPPQKGRNQPNPENTSNHSQFSHKSVDMHIDDILNLPLAEMNKTLDTYPASYKLAMLHRQANIFGVIEDNYQNRDPDTSDYYIHQGQPVITPNPNYNTNNKICGCCFKQDGLRQLDLGCHLQELTVFGSGYTMFFTMMTYSIYILTVMFFTSGLFNLVSNIVGEECVTYKEVEKMQHKKLTPKEIIAIIKQKGMCQKSFITIISQGNKAMGNSNLNLCNEVLLMFSVIIIIILLHYLRNQLKKLEYQIDQDYLTPADYTIMVSNIHPDHIKSLRHEIEQNGVPGKITPVQKIVFTFDYKSQLKLQNEKIQLFQNFFKNHKELLLAQRSNSLQEQQRFNLESANASLQNDLKDINDRITNNQQRFFNAEANKDIFTGKAIISLQSEMDKKAILYYHQKRYSSINKAISRTYRKYIKKEKMQSTYRMTSGTNQLLIEQASEPTDVFWTNLKYTTFQLFLRRSLSSLFVMLSITLSTIILLLLKDLSNKVKTGDYDVGIVLSEAYQKRLSQGLSFIIAFCISLINWAMSKIIKTLSLFEKRSTRTEADISFSLKLAWVLFINSALISFVISVIQQKDYFNNGGLITNMSYLFITNTVISVLFQLFPIGYIFYLLRNRAFTKGTSSLAMNQEMANLALQKMDFNISFYYASMAKDVFFTCFYSSIIPGGTLIVLIGLITLYWIYKYNLLRRCSYRYELGADLALSVLDLLEYSVVIYSSSSAIWNWILGRGVAWYSIIAFLLALLNALFPSHYLASQILTDEQYDTESPDYETAKANFSSNYQLANQSTNLGTFLNMKNRREFNYEFTKLLDGKLQK